MDVAERFGNKGIHQRLGPSRLPANKVCFHWRAGRCNRHPCPFLHGELPPKPPRHHQPPAGGIDRGTHHRSLVRRNQSAAASPSPSNWGKHHQGRSAGVTVAPPRKVLDKACSFFLAGNCQHGENCRFLHSWFVSDSFSIMTTLQGHQQVESQAIRGFIIPNPNRWDKGVRGVTLPSGSNKLCTGSKDGSVRIWDCQTGQCIRVINLEGEIGSIISEGPWVFVGIPNAVKAWNTLTMTDLSLNGPTKQVYAMAVGNEMLFAGIHDGCILAWKSNVVGNSFEPTAKLSGHQLAVVSLVVGSRETRLFSGSMDSTIKVWDLTTLQCLQTLTEHKDVVMSVLCWDQFLLSCSLDQTIKVWVATESGNLEVTYTHTEEHGVLALCGVCDAQSKPVLLCSCNDNSVRLYDLPSFTERGKIFSKEEVRALQSGPCGLFFTGDGTGELKVWKWVTDETPAS